MDPLTNLYDRLRHRAAFVADASAAAGRRAWQDEPPQLQDWLRFWSDGDTDLGNLRNFQHWIARARPERRSRG